MENYSILITLLLCAIIHFGYIAKRSPYNWKKILTVIFLHCCMPYLLAISSPDPAIGLAYLIFAIPILIISWAMNRERTGKKIFKWSLPKLRSKKKNKHSNSMNNDDEAMIINELKRQNSALRNDSVDSFNEFDELEQLKSIRFGNE